MKFKEFITEVMGAMDVAMKTNFRYCYVAVDDSDPDKYYVIYQKFGLQEKPKSEGPMSKARATMRANTLIVQNTLKKKDASTSA